ncbi:unnamed protein product [Heterobilharzia americana]|nr:unnamed protein product [Heterobilharzia americana]
MKWLNISTSRHVADEVDGDDSTERMVTYSWIAIPLSMVKSGTLVEFTPNKICSEQTDPDACSQASTNDFQCYWCPEISVCSNGRDVHYPNWINTNCSTEVTTSEPIYSNPSWETTDRSESPLSTQSHTYEGPDYSGETMENVTDILETTEEDSDHSENQKTTRGTSDLIFGESNIFLYIAVSSGVIIAAVMVGFTVWLFMCRKK